MSICASAEGSPPLGRTCRADHAFTTFVLFQLANVFNARTESATVWSRESLTNTKLWSAVGTVAGFQILIVTIGPFQNLFGTTALTPGQWLLAILTATAVIATEELRKALDRRRARPTLLDQPRVPATTAEPCFVGLASGTTFGDGPENRAENHAEDRAEDRAEKGSEEGDVAAGRR